MNTNTTDKVQTGDSVTGTSTSTTWQCPYTQHKAEQGWECPRCGRINAPWVQHCDCSRSYYYPTWTSDHIYVGDKPEWWEQITCSSDTFKIHPESDPIYTVGGSDYWNPKTKTYENVSNHTTNKVDSNIKVESATYSPNCHTPHYTTETCPNNVCENH